MPRFTNPASIGGPSNTPDPDPMIEITLSITALPLFMQTSETFVTAIEDGSTNAGLAPGTQVKLLTSEGVDTGATATVVGTTAFRSIDDVPDLWVTKHHDSDKRTKAAAMPSQAQTSITVISMLTD